MTKSPIYLERQYLCQLIFLIFEILGTMISVDQSTNDKGQHETKGNNVEEVDACLLPVEENTTSEEKEQLR